MLKDILEKFISKVLIIKNLNPKRREPGDGSDGYCDCIGLVIGAVRRMGLKWTGIHGCNWAARKEFVELKKINSVSDLAEGDVVLKGRPKSNANWNLPSRYRQNGKYYNGDLTDYYHAGVVTKISPLNITHMSSKMMVDTKLGKWNYHGILKVLSKENKGSDVIDKLTPTSGCLAAVVAPSGSTVNMRKIPNIRGSLITRVPIRTIVTVLEPGEEWAKIEYGRNIGYMMAKYLDIVGDGKGEY